MANRSLSEKEIKDLLDPNLGRPFVIINGEKIYVKASKLPTHLTGGFITTRDGRRVYVDGVLDAYKDTGV